MNAVNRDKAWRRTTIAIVIFTLIRVWYGYEWLFKHGLQKLTADKAFNPSAYFANAIENASAGWWAWFLENLAVPFAGLWGVLITWGEVLVGLGALVGLLTIPAVIGGLTMNMAFMLSGTAGINPILFGVGCLILWGGIASRTIALDRWVWPRITGRFSKDEIK